MDIIFYQPVTNETVTPVRERYSSLGWGEIYLQGSGNNVIALQFKWCKEEPFLFLIVKTVKGLSFKLFYLDVCNFTLK